FSASPTRSTRTATNGASSTVMRIFSTGVTRQNPSGSLRSTVEKSRTSASRPIGVPSWNHRPLRLMTMSMSPQWAGFHRCTGGSRRLAGPFDQHRAEALAAPLRIDREGAEEDGGAMAYPHRPLAHAADRPGSRPGDEGQTQDRRAALAQPLGGLGVAAGAEGA